MNRRNYTLHFALAGALVVLAAAAGRIERWEGSRVGDAPRQQGVLRGTAPAPRRTAAPDEEGEAEVLVRFKPGVSGERMREIAASLNDRVEDEIESVEGLTAIDDLDDEEAARVAEEYASLPEVEYAEPNFRIEADPVGVSNGFGFSGRSAESLPRAGRTTPCSASSGGSSTRGSVTAAPRPTSAPSPRGIRRRAARRSSSPCSTAASTTRTPTSPATCGTAPRTSRCTSTRSSA